ncbi:hypothetical protein AB0H83_48515 [Dactylosporangium sp. NPDC050688]|uniref:hypothetical protein n=1 Tax=Dactylosporangium sp. NPDC050688 TaxID=3157217 RepID=UPI003408A01B
MTNRGRRRSSRFLALVVLAVQGALLALASSRPARPGRARSSPTPGASRRSPRAPTTARRGRCRSGSRSTSSAPRTAACTSTNNGDVTFGSPYTGFSGLDLAAFGSPIIAVAFFDVDTRAAGTKPVSYGPITYGGRPAYCVNWVDVGREGDQHEQTWRRELAGGAVVAVGGAAAFGLFS